MFDLSTLAEATSRLEEGVEHKMLGPDGEATDVVLIIASYDSDRVKSAIRRQVAANAGESGPDALERIQDAMNTAAVAGWRGFGMDGKPVDCKPEIVAQLLRFQWFRKQVQDVAGNQALFFGR